MLKCGKMGRLRRVFEVILGRNVINRHLFRGIRGLRPANLDCRIASGNDGRLGRWLRAVCNLINTPHSALSCHSLPHGARDYGRSMIEMLGVLAIIAVLSVGGIAGYSKAMTKWKTNKTIEQTANIISGFTTLLLNQKQLRGTSENYPNELDSSYPSDIELFKTLGIIDEEMLVDGELKTPFGGNFCFNGVDNEIDIDIYDLPREACMAIATATWGNGKFDIAVNSRRNFYYSSIYCYYSNAPSQVSEGATLGCYHDGGVPLTPDKAAYGCSCEDAGCCIEIYFDSII